MSERPDQRTMHHYEGTLTELQRHLDDCPACEIERLLAELAAARRETDTLREALGEVLDVVVWMSGSPSFGPEGEAHEGWVKVRDRALTDLFALAAVSAGERAS